MAAESARVMGRPPVFLADSLEVEQSMRNVRRRLCGPGDWLVPLVRAASGDGDTVLVRLGPSSVGGHTGVVTRIRVGECIDREGTMYVPIRWEAASHAGLFPVLDGDLELSALGDARCLIAIKASYRPPFDNLGRFLDAAVLHRVAESTVHSFLQRLAESLHHDGAEGVPPSAAAGSDRS